MKNMTAKQWMRGENEEEEMKKIMNNCQTITLLVILKKYIFLYPFLPITHKL